MENPFELLNERLNRIETLLENIYNQRIIPEAGDVSPKIMTTKTVATYLNVTPSTIYKMTSSREIPHSKRGKILYFDKKEIDEWVLKNKRLTNQDIDDLAKDYIRKHPIKFL